MRSLTIFLVLWLCLPNVSAANKYVRSGATGAANGNNWTDAWANTTSISWASVNPGDTVWIAGGTYSAFTVQSSGTTGSPISIKRATISNVECTGATGWNPAFDAQVIINVPDIAGAAGIRIVPPTSNYITVDGQVSSGIKFVLPTPAINYHVNTAYQIYGILTVGNSNTFRSLEFFGPTVPAANIGISAGNNYLYGWKTNLTISSCTFQGLNSALFIGDTHYMTVEQCEFSMNYGNSVNHDNIAYVFSGNNGVFRNNYVHDWGAMGLLFSSQSPMDNWKVYGNVFRNIPSSGTAISFHPWGGGGVFTYGPNWMICHNTLADVYLGLRADYSAFGGYPTTGGTCVNNIFWNAGVTFGAFSHDYNFYSANVYEPHGVALGQDPFVDLDGSDCHLNRSLPGQAISSEYSPDRDGVSRASVWDMGAYVYDGFEVPTLAYPTFQLESALLGSGYLSNSIAVFQATLTTSPLDGGRAMFKFVVPSTTNYILKGLVKAEATYNDSVFINIDSEPETPTHIWDIAPLTAGYETRYVSWRGNGTWDVPQYPTNLFYLTAGEHTMYVRGRESYTYLDSLTIETPPAALGTNYTTLTASSALISEDEGYFDITINRDGDLSQASSVSYVTVSGTGQPYVHYLPVSGTVTFDVAESSKVVSVMIIDNALVDVASVFNFVLIQPVNTVLGVPSSMEITVTNNDLVRSSLKHWTTP